MKKAISIIVMLGLLCISGLAQTVEIEITNIGPGGDTPEFPLYSPIKSGNDLTINMAALPKFDYALASYQWDFGSGGNVTWCPNSNQYGILFGASAGASSITVGAVCAPSVFRSHVVMTYTLENGENGEIEATKLIYVNPQVSTEPPVIDPPPVPNPCPDYCSTFPTLPECSECSTVDPCAEGCDPVKCPQLCEDTFKYEGLLLLRLTEGWDTGIFVQSKKVNKCKLSFWKAKLPITEDGELVATFEESMGKNNPILLPVKSKYLTRGEIADSLELQCVEKPRYVSVWYCNSEECKDIQYVGVQGMDVDEITDLP